MSFYLDDEEEVPEENDTLLGGSDSIKVGSEDSPYIIKAPSTAYELLDNAMEDLGTGKFHYLLMAICGYGFFADAAETQMLALLYPTLEEDFNADEEELAAIGAATNTGMLVGALIVGKFSDSYGRRLAYLFSLAICFIAGFASSFANSIWVFAAWRFLLGIGYCGNIITCTTLLVEFSPLHVRGFYVALTSVFFGVGAIIIAALSWAIIPSIGWKWLVRIASFLVLPVVFMLCSTPESPRFLLQTKRYDKVIEVMEMVAEKNGASLPPYFNEKTLASLSLEEEKSKLGTKKSLLTLLSKDQLRIIIPLFLVWFTNNFSTTILTFIPLEAEKHFPKDEDITFKTGIILAFGILLGSIAQVFVIEKVSRLFQIRAGFLLSIITTALLGVAKTPAGLFAAAFSLTFFEQFVVGTLYLYTPELFPTSIRVTAFGICQTGHRVASIIAPFVVASTDKIGFDETSYIFAGVYGAGFLLSLTLHISTFKKALAED